MGTPPQNFTALFDTGSPAFIVGGSNCTTCGSKNLFDPSLSSTYVDSPGKFKNYLFSTGADSIPFSENEGATGYLVQDTIAWGDLKVENQSFVLCDTMAEALDVMPIDGIMGSTSWPYSSSARHGTFELRPLTFTNTYCAVGLPGAGNSWYWNLVDSGQLDSSVYSFYIPPSDINGGEVTLGGIDDTKFEGELEWSRCDVKATTLFESYVLDQLAVYSDGIPLHNGTSAADGTVAPLPVGFAIMDTGTAFMQTPDYATAEILYAQISPNITQIDPAGAWGAPCDELDAVAPDLTFTLGTTAAAVNVTIPKKYFNLGEYPGLSGICQALFNNPSAGIGDSWFYNGKAEWLIGSPLIKQYYTAWDAEKLRIGWGQLKGGPGF